MFGSFRDFHQFLGPGIEQIPDSHATSLIPKSSHAEPFHESALVLFTGLAPGLLYSLQIEEAEAQVRSGAPR